MSRGRWLCAAGAAAAGLIALQLLPARVDPLPPQGYRMDRESAIQRARAVSLKFGVDATHWRPLVESDLDAGVADWSRTYARDDSDRLKTPFFVTVLLTAPASERKVRIVLGATGGLQSYAEENGAGSRKSSRDAATVAADALAEMTGKQAPSFRPTTTAARARDALDFVWEAPSSRPELNTWTARASVGPEGLRSCSIDANFAARIREERVSSRAALTLLDAVGAAIFLILFSVALILSVFAWIRRRLYRPLLFAGAFIGAASFILDVYFGSAGDAQAIRTAGSQMAAGLLLGVLIGTIAWACPAAVGEAWTRTVIPCAWKSLVAASSGALRARIVGSSAASGFLFGILGAAVPFVVLFLFPAASWSSFAEAQLASPWPALEWLFPPVPLTPLATVAFLIPLISAKVRWLPVAVALQFAVAWLAELNSPWLEGNTSAVLLVAAAGAMLVVAVFRAYDVLTALLVVSVSRAILFSLWYAATASPALRGSAGTMHVLLGAVFVASLVIAWRGREVAEDLRAPDSELEPVSQRERLKSEFSLAREAQQRMLPATAPSVPGMEIAAVCQPAREVGGDLYDYLRLADGRQAFIVADVSGKGMPAALYMTLTKGLLAAASEECDDLAEIASRLNRHLREAGRRRVFVTAALAAADPRSGALEYVRAGHNPVVWCSPARGFTRLVRPNGMGLGVGPPALFAKTLEMERIEMAEGDSVVLYSDGVTEAMNAALELYGEERLERAVAAAAALDAHGIRQAILADLKGFLAGEPPQDDVTVLVLKAARAGAVSEREHAGAATLGKTQPLTGDPTLG
ncbi:MAG: PP2C family protein-serine/threonine phosphatase [Bryobacteraceae bacterium]|nr:PP2C family protein-serine/threonine phosphatase [Bryobacteraceae bacterium]